MATAGRRRAVLATRLARGLPYRLLDFAGRLLSVNCLSSKENPLQLLPLTCLSGCCGRGVRAAGMSGVGAAILEGPEHAQHESVRVYLSQSVLPAITEALTAMEKERCPNPVPTRSRHSLDMHMCCAVPNDQSFGLRTSSRSFAIRRHKAETGWLRRCLCL